MIRAFIEGIGWFVFACAIARAAGLAEFSIHLAAPLHDECLKDHAVQPKPMTVVFMSGDAQPIKATPDDRRFTPINLERLKREATALKKSQPVTHSQALELLSRQAGYKTYAALRADLKAKGSPT